MITKTKLKAATSRHDKAMELFWQTQEEDVTRATEREYDKAYKAEMDYLATLTKDEYESIPWIGDLCLDYEDAKEWSE